MLHTHFGFEETPVTVGFLARYCIIRANFCSEEITRLGYRMQNAVALYLWGRGAAGGRRPSLYAKMSM
jgi:hypothetical protein